MTTGSELTLNMLLSSECIDGMAMIMPEHYMREMSGPAKTDPSGSLNPMATCDMPNNTEVNGKMCTDYMKTLPDDCVMHDSPL